MIKLNLNEEIKDTNNASKNYLQEGIYEVEIKSVSEQVTSKGTPFLRVVFEDQNKAIHTESYYMSEKPYNIQRLQKLIRACGLTSIENGVETYDHDEQKMIGRTVEITLVPQKNNASYMEILEVNQVIKPHEDFNEEIKKLDI